MLGFMTNSPSGRRPQEPFPVRGPEDILAFIPHSLGFVPRNSLVLMTVDTVRLGATLRLDLPASALDYSDFAAKVCEILRTDLSADGVLMALYTDRAWKRPDVPPYRRLVSALGQCLADAGMPIRDGWVVSAAAWREYFCVDGSCCPWPGHPLGDISASTLSAEMVYRGSAYAPSLGEAVDMDLPPRWADASDAAAHCAAYARRLKGRWCGYEQFEDTLRIWDWFISAAAADARSLPGAEPGCPRVRAHPEAAGFLLASLHARPVRDTLLVMAALGLKQALTGAADCNLLSADGKPPLVPPGFGPAGAVENAGGSGGGPLQQRSDSAAQTFRDVLVGQYLRAPQWRGMDAAFSVFAELLAAAAADQCADREATAALLSLLAWIEWARGRGSRAQVYLVRCLAAYPGYRLAQLLEELLATGLFPLWARSAGTAWKGSSEQHPGGART